MSTSSFTKRIVIRKKEAAEALVEHLQKQCGATALPQPAIKIASREELEVMMKKR